MRIAETDIRRVVQAMSRLQETGQIEPEDGDDDNYP